MMTDNALTTKTIRALVGDIYDASCDPSYWEAAMEKLCQLVQASSAGIYIKDHHQKSSFAMYTYGIAKAANFAYNHGMAKLDPSFNIMASKPIGIEPNLINLDIPNFPHPVYRQFILKPAGVHYTAGVNLFNNEQWHVGIGLHRPKQATAFDDESLALIYDLIPHFQRAIRIQREFTRLRTRNQTLETSLSQLALGIVITNEFGQAEYINPVAQSLLAHHPAISISEDRIKAFGNTQNSELYCAIQEIAQTHSKHDDKATHAFGLYHPDNDAPLAIMLTPLTDSNYHEYNLDVTAKVLISIADPDINTRLSSHAIQQAYKLTAAEAIVAIELANGLTLEKISKHNQVSIETVRSQLKSIFLKTGTNRQVDLTRLLLSGPFKMNN